MDATSELPSWRRVLVVVAHPDDESFGLGGLIDRFVTAGAVVSVLCLTRGEASTLGGDLLDLTAVRDAELRSAATELGVSRTTLLTHPDGGLALVGEPLERDVAAEVAEFAPDGVLVFDPVDGVTGHPDHQAASRAAMAVAARQGLPVLGWALSHDVADALDAEFGAGFAGHDAADLTEVVVDRTRQRRAVQCHATQAVPGSVLWRRLELQGDLEHVRHLVRAHPRV